MSIAEYKNQEKKDMIEELLGSMYENYGTDEETDLVDVNNRQLEAMLDYYKQVELEAGRLTEKVIYYKSVTKSLSQKMWTW